MSEQESTAVELPPGYSLMSKATVDEMSRLFGEEAAASAALREAGRLQKMGEEVIFVQAPFTILATSAERIKKGLERRIPGAR